MELTQAELAELTNISLMSIRRYESGSRTPTIDVLRKISEVLKIPLKVIVGKDADYYGLNENNLNNAEKIEHFEKLIETYLHSVSVWSSDKAFNEEEERNIKEHFAELLLRYKNVLSTVGNAIYNSDYRKSIKRLIDDDNETLVPFLKEKYFQEAAERELKELSEWCNNLAWYIAKGSTNIPLKKVMEENNKPKGQP